MAREYKALSFTNIKASGDHSGPRVRTGVCAVMGNIDSVGDRIKNGAFTKTIREGSRRVKFLWNHGYETPPLASIKELKEVGRDGLPAEVLEKAPDATGGLVVTREYFNNDLADWVLQAIDAGEITEMSFAFDTVKASNVTETKDGKEFTVRELEELRLFDCSDVNWGANEATVAIGAKNLLSPMPLGVLASQLAMLEQELKAGRRNADSDQKLIDMIHASAVNLGAACDPKSTDEPQKAGELPATADEPPDGEKAEAAESGTSLSPEWLELQKAKTQALRLRMHTNI